MFDNIIETLLSAIVEFWIWLITSNRNASEEEKWWKQNVQKSESSFSVYMGGTYKMSTGWINMIPSLIFFFENYFVICIYVPCGKNICFYLSINVVRILLNYISICRSCYGPNSNFLRQFLFFFNAKNATDYSALVEVCRLLRQFVQNCGVYYLIALWSTFCPYTMLVKLVIHFWWNKYLKWFSLCYFNIVYICWYTHLSCNVLERDL